MRDRAVAAVVITAVVLALLPIAVTSNVVLNLITFMLIVALSAQGWNILGGYGGQFSFGHAAFFGTGAYAMALAQVRFSIPAVLAMPLAIGLAALVGYIIGFLSFRARLRGSYFALVTLAFAEVMRILTNASPFTGGAAGLLIPLNITPFSLQFADRRLFYWLALALVIATLALTLAVTRSRFGAQLVAVRENEDAARALGVDVMAVKLRAITLSAAITAAAGCLYAQKYLYLDAQIGFGTWISVEALLAPIIGGLGTVFGPLVGAVVLLGLGEITKTTFQALTGTAVPGADLVVFGALLILCVSFAPRGLLGLLDIKKLKHQATRAAS
jgi:branched-chain amino acid transport system permease protein